MGVGAGAGSEAGAGAGADTDTGTGAGAASGSTMPDAGAVVAFEGATAHGGLPSNALLAWGAEEPHQVYVSGTFVSDGSFQVFVSDQEAPLLSLDGDQQKLFRRHYEFVKGSKTFPSTTIENVPAYIHTTRGEPSLLMCNLTITWSTTDGVPCCTYTMRGKSKSSVLATLSRVAKIPPGFDRLIELPLLELRRVAALVHDTLEDAYEATNDAFRAGQEAALQLSTVLFGERDDSALWRLTFKRSQDGNALTGVAYLPARGTPGATGKNLYAIIRAALKAQDIFAPEQIADMRVLYWSGRDLKDVPDTEELLPEIRDDVVMYHVL